MLQNFRDNLKGIGTTIAVIIAIPFALTGVDTFFVSGSAVQKVATVNDESITELELQRAINRQRQMLLSQYGENILQMLSDDMLRGQALNQMVRQSVITQTARSEGMGVASASIQKSLFETPQFQTEGRFDTELFNYVLRQANHTPSSYTKLLRQDFVGNQFVQGIVATDFLTAPELEQSVGIAEQKRDFYYLTVPVEPVLETVEVSEDVARQRYEESKDQLVVPEQVVVEYLELTTESLMAKEEVEEQQIRKVYESELENFSQAGGDQRRLSHILIHKDDDSAARIAEIQSRLAEGEDFAELAKSYSQDAGTAEQGGDLGYIDPAALPEAIAATANKLSLNQVSEPVESDSGIHFIKVTAIDTLELPVYEEQKERIADDLKREAVAERFAVVLDELRESVYNAETLQGPADQFGLELQLSEPFSRSGGNGIASNSKIVNAAFSKEVLTDGYASEVMELSDGKAVVVKLREKIPERVKSFEEVQEQLLADLKREAAKEQVKKRGAELLARVNNGERVEDIAKAEGLDWQVSLDTGRSGGNVDNDARTRAFEMAVPVNEPLVEGFASNNGDYLIVELTSVEYPKPEDLPQAQRQTLARNLTRMSGDRAIQAYQSWLVKEADIERKTSGTE